MVCNALLFLNMIKLCVFFSFPALVDFTEEEPLYQYVPENESDHPVLNGDALFTQSLLLLSDGLASGALLSQYEQLYRRNSTLAITEARKPEHQNKNRYRDISPCNLINFNSYAKELINTFFVLQMTALEWF